jgi:hypothetical protein
VSAYTCVCMPLAYVLFVEDAGKWYMHLSVSDLCYHLYRQQPLFNRWRIEDDGSGPCGGYGGWTVRRSADV